MLPVGKFKAPKVGPIEDLLEIYEDTLYDNEGKTYEFLRIGLWILEMQ